MNNQENYMNLKCNKIKMKEHALSGSSNYSTCSDNSIKNVTLKETIQTSAQSTILAGQIPSNSYCQAFNSVSEESLIYRLPNVDINNETNYSINILDQNLDILTEDDDIYTDCKDISKSESSEDDSTKYLQIESMQLINSNNDFCNSCSNLRGSKENMEITNSRSPNLLSVATKCQTDHDKLKTILEQTEITHVTNSIIKNPPLNFINNTGDFIVEMVDKLKSCDNHKNSIKRILFTNEDNIINNINEEYIKTNEVIMKKKEKYANTLIDTDMNKKKDINTDKNCNIHNTTESFVLWEKYCKISNDLSTQRSLSLSELNSKNESYRGDDEYSTTFKSIDDTYLSHCLFDPVNNNMSPRQKHCRRRSKSCDSLLKEVKCLPHILYDKFLKCLAMEIENIRKQHIVCTCQKHNRKWSNKENIEKNAKCAPTIPKISIPHENKHSSLKKTNSYTRLSPNSILKSSENIQTLSPKSPNKTPTISLKKRGLYSWQKEIVSPVGEYIRGKRQSPFKNSPSKKKL